MIARKVFAACALLVFASVLPTRAAEPVPSSGPALEKRLASYDPRAVTAARHYFETPAIKTGMVAMTENMNKAMLSIVAKQNPNLSPAQLAKINQVVGDAIKERLDLLIHMNMVVALDTFTTDELVALDTFYSSPSGAAILAKMPRMAAQLPAMMRAIMPDYLAEIKAKLKENGAELKL